MTARYTPARRGGLAASKRSARYITHRPDHDGQRGQRLIFGAAQDNMDKTSVYQQLDAADGSYHYRLILNPGEGHAHGSDLPAWTRDVMAELDARQGGAVSWVAVVHDDHTVHDHVHVVAVTSQRLGRADLLALRTEAGAAWDRQVELVQGLREEGPLPGLDQQIQQAQSVLQEIP